MNLPSNCKLRVRHKRFYKSRVAQDLDKLVRLVDHESYLTIKYAFAYSRKEAEELKLSSEEIIPRGGKTEVDIVNEKNEVIAKGEALCCDRDNFNRRLGREIATARAIKQLTEGDVQYIIRE
jgi:hypothetical protein